MAFPNPGVIPQSVTFRDAKGFTAVMRFYITQVTTVEDAATLWGTVAGPLAAMTNGAVQGANGPGGETGTVQYGTQAQYLGAEDKAALLFQDSAGGLHRYRVPCPKVSIFFADEQTVNPSNSHVAAFVTAMTTASGAGAFMSSKSGLQIVNFFGGLLWRAPTRRRYGYLQLSPALTPEEPGE